MYTNEYKVQSKYKMQSIWQVQNSMMNLWRYMIMDMAVVDGVLKLVMLAGVIRMIK